MFGRMLFAHWPITLLLVPSFFINRMAYATFMSDPLVAYANYPTDSLIMAAVVLVVGVWSLYWGYLAFSRATQRKGFVTLLCYVVATPLAYYLSKLVIGAILKGL
jgi:ABC-type spermidine/putrescine transport system permease subunit I